eukprot:CAMPEP_0168510590 /NCGR_PEP_ID=MMETSP0405-20121227/1561_1 /TAXON_ID=498012 /ORGANISM="Trichosphaerium sp, Strain Am-I-7 wt" /LENGTH=135 /DNA_ID=CAMNT_0008528467 /DNA_START=123 /DNA_END=530 /DNA_ORIENTATION=+
MGMRLMEYFNWKDKVSKREVDIKRILYWIQNTVWKVLFGRAATDLRSSATKDVQYMIIDDEPIVTEYISVPKDLTGLNCASFVGGIVQGLLDAAEFSAVVDTRIQKVPDKQFPRTVILIDFDPEFQRANSTARMK